MAEATARRDLPPRLHGRPLGPLLCWGVVFADIGTSVYYTPGILYGQVGVHAALFVSMTLVVFILLTVKYAEVAARYPEGGGVVTVATRALHPLAGALGGLLILVDYFLTAALSALSGIIYISIIVGPLKSVLVQATVGALVLLALLNWAGISASARTSVVFAVLAAAAQLTTVVAVVVHVGLPHIGATFPRMFSGPRLTPVTLLTGFAGAFLAFSGLESIAQLSPAMAEPRKRIARRAMLLVVITIGLTSPLLTLWSTTLLADVKDADPNQFISLLGGYAAGQWLAWSVAISAALLLIFASNTAVIGSYHVFLALSKMRFLPRIVEHRNRLRDTPTLAIGLAVGIPLAVVVLSQANVGLLGDLYAFGLLGAFAMTCFSLDIVRWHEGWRGIAFAVGVVTTVLVTLAWMTNWVAKPLATMFGGGITVVGMIIAVTTYSLEQRRGLPAVFPHVHREPHPVVMIARGRRMRPCQVLVILQPDAKKADTLVEAAIASAGRLPVLFVLQGATPESTRRPRLMEVIDPYLNDRTAQEVFGRTERDARDRIPDRRYLYVPWNAPDGTMQQIVETARPATTLTMPEATVVTSHAS
ncbi:MAG TPA: APC family permease [Candidatus Dormibacteraeota bacterium]